MVNRNPVCQWFITFPRWNEYGDIKEFEKIAPKSKWGYVVKESHEDGGIHYHLMLKLTKGITKSKMLSYWTEKFPNDYKRIDIQPTKDFRAAYNYLGKEQLDVYEWGKGMNIPVWLQAIKDEWEVNRVDRELCEKRIQDRIKLRMKELFESEIYSCRCRACDKELPCEDHDGESVFCQF